MSARPGVSPAVTPEKRGSAAAVPPPRRVQNSCYENLIDGMCCQLPGENIPPAPDKKEKRKGTGLLRETRLCRLRGLRRQPKEGSPRYGKFTGRSPASVSTQGRPLAPGAPPEMPPARGSRSAHPGLTGSRAERHRTGHGRKKDRTGNRGWCLSGRLREDAKAAFQFAEIPEGCLLWHGGRTGQI